MRVKSLHVRTSPNLGGGCGSFAARPEEAHAKALARMYPEFIATAYALQSGQWTLRFKSLLPWKTPISAIANSGAVDYRRNTAVGKRSRTVSLTDFEDSSLDSMLCSESGTARKLRATLRDALGRQQMILDESVTVVALGRRLATMEGWDCKHGTDGNIWKKKV